MKHQGQKKKMKRDRREEIRGIKKYNEMAVEELD